MSGTREEVSAGSGDGGSDSGSKNPLAVSDDEFMKMMAPEGTPLSEAQNSEPEKKPEAEGKGEGEAEPKTEGEGEGESEADPSKKEEEGKDGKDGKDEKIESEGKKPEPNTITRDAKGRIVSTKEPETKTEAEPVREGAEAPKTYTPQDYETFFKKVVQTPLKANGKQIDIRSPEEAIGLMQMGANYTLKLQQMAPYRKAVAMLEKNDLLDEGKLSFLIDIANKNPDVIKKLVKEAGIDPSDIDTSVEPAYVPGNHRVSDTEVRFRGVMDDMKSTPEGKETLKLIHTDWDDASKDMLWENPDVLKIIQEQRENGVYARISAEVNRQKTLGTIPAEVPFLHAYKHVGDQLMAQTKTPVAGTKTPVVVATRPAATKPTVKNGDRAAAATVPRTTPKTAEVKTNPLAMSDEAFMKAMENRL